MSAIALAIRPKDRSLRQHLSRALAAPFAFLIVALLVLAFASQAEVQAQVDGPAAQPSRAQQLLEAHGCWSGPAPSDMEGKIPGHAVVTWPGAVSPTYGGQRAVGVALEHVFGDERRGMVVHGFCR